MKESTILTDRQTDRVVYFDYLRVLATLAIVALHTCGKANVEIASTNWNVLNIYDSLTRWGVPVFVMISGALFLGKDIPMQKLLKKNILRIITAFLFWSLLYTMWKIQISEHSSSLRDVLLTFFKGHYHMWFLYMIVCLYLIVPLLNKIVARFRLALYFVLLAFLFAFFIPQCINIVGLKSNYVSESLSEIMSFTHMNFVLGFSGYFVLGYLLNRVCITKKQEYLSYVLGFCGAAFTIVATFWLSRRDQVSTEMFYDSMTVNILFFSIAVFVFAKQHLNRSLKSEKSQKTVSFLSKCTFGVYLVHPLMIDCLNRFLGINNLSFNPILSVPILALAVFIISMALSAAINKIPFLKKWIV